MHYIYSFIYLNYICFPWQIVISHVSKLTAFIRLSVSWNSSQLTKRLYFLWNQTCKGQCWRQNCIFLHGRRVFTCSHSIWQSALAWKTVWKQYLLYSTRFSTPYTTVVYMKIGQEAAEITMFISILYKVYFVKI